jgi:hypothetical protein
MDERSEYATPNVPYIEHHPPPPSETVGWADVSASMPCPRCGAREGCSVAEGGGFVRCRLIPSLHPVAGGGWLHRLPVRSASRSGQPDRG